MGLDIDITVRITNEFLLLYDTTLHIPYAYLIDGNYTGSSQPCTPVPHAKTDICCLGNGTKFCDVFHHPKLVNVFQSPLDSGQN